jgi:hypothetical protein
MKDNEIYKHAIFHTVDETIRQLRSSGFEGFSTFQTLLKMNQNKVEPPIPLYNKGSFAAIEALK